MSGGDRIDGGLDTARVPAAASNREATVRAIFRRKAVRYLTETTGNADIVEILGLDGAGHGRRCANPACGQPFTPTRRGHRQQTCSPPCAQAARRVAVHADA